MAAWDDVLRIDSGRRFHAASKRNYAFVTWSSPAQDGWLPPVQRDDVFDADDGHDRSRRPRLWQCAASLKLGVEENTEVTYNQWLNCTGTGGGSLSLKLLDYTFVRLVEKFRTSIKHSNPPCTKKVCFCSQL